jgi:beta-galactosidase
LRWDDVTYQPGEVRVVAYKNGQKWAEERVQTTENAVKLRLQADRSALKSDGADLSFITVSVSDQNGLMVPRSKNRIQFTLEGPGEIVATDNGDATNLEPFGQTHRAAYNGLALAIVRTKSGQSGQIRVRASSSGLAGAEITLSSGAS